LHFEKKKITGQFSLCVSVRAGVCTSERENYFKKDLTENKKKGETHQER